MGSKKRMLTGLAAAGVLVGALTGGGVALAGTGGTAQSATSVAAIAPVASTSAASTSAAGTTAKHGLRFLHRAHVRRTVLRTSATYLGLKPQELRAQLKSGQTLAQVATARGKSVSGLENAIVARADKRIGHSKKLSAARKAKLAADVKANVGAFVTAKHPLGHELRHLYKKAGSSLSAARPASPSAGGSAE